MSHADEYVCDECGVRVKADYLATTTTGLSGIPETYRLPPIGWLTVTAQPHGKESHFCCFPCLELWADRAGETESERSPS